MGKESPGTSPRGRGPVKWPEMQEIIHVNLTVREKGRLASLHYLYMDVYFSAKTFSNRKNK